MFPTNSATDCHNLREDEFKLEIESKSEVVANGTNINLQCHVRLEKNPPTLAAPQFNLTWKFQGSNCSIGNVVCLNSTLKNNHFRFFLDTGNENKDCLTVINSSSFNSWDASFTALVVSNAQHTDSGTYICELIFECQDSNGAWINYTQSKSIRVYMKPYYGAQMAVILSICFLLLAILIGMYVYSKKKRQRIRAKYDAMVASHKIQIAPAKVTNSYLRNS